MLRPVICKHEPFLHRLPFNIEPMAVSTLDNNARYPQTTLLLSLASRLQASNLSIRGLPDESFRIAFDVLRFRFLDTVRQHPTTRWEIGKWGWKHAIDSTQIRFLHSLCLMRPPYSHYARTYSVKSPNVKNFPTSGSGAIQIDVKSFRNI